MFAIIFLRVRGFSAYKTVNQCKSWDYWERWRVCAVRQQSTCLPHAETKEEILTEEVDAMKVWKSENQLQVNSI